mmetsp:Transcript_9046/g.27464  ORF Transcript_9046/g.27464 Transcript_9046/m.27464 type:complete len:259 (-) Transcript_9046:3-779(-)
MIIMMLSSGKKPWRLKSPEGVSMCLVSVYRATFCHGTSKLVFFSLLPSSWNRENLGQKFFFSLKSTSSRSTVPLRCSSSAPSGGTPVRTSSSFLSLTILRSASSDSAVAMRTLVAAWASATRASASATRSLADASASATRAFATATFALASASTTADSANETCAFVGASSALPFALESCKAKAPLCFLSSTTSSAGYRWHGTAMAVSSGTVAGRDSPATTLSSRPIGAGKDRSAFASTRATPKRREGSQRRRVTVQPC